MKVKTFVLITDFYNLNVINIHQTSELLYENLPATLLPSSLPNNDSTVNLILELMDVWQAWRINTVNFSTNLSLHRF